MRKHFRILRLLNSPSYHILTRCFLFSLKDWHISEWADRKDQALPALVWNVGRPSCLLIWVCHENTNSGLPGLPQGHLLLFLFWSIHLDHLGHACSLLIPRCVSSSFFSIFQSALLLFIVYLSPREETSLSDISRWPRNLYFLDDFDMLTYQVMPKLRCIFPLIFLTEKQYNCLIQKMAMGMFKVSVHTHYKKA